MQNLLRSPHASPPLVPPGDIAALQNMPLEVLNLGFCEQLTGKPAVRVGRISKTLPQGNTRSVPGTFLKMTNPSPLLQRSTGDISVLQNMALTGLGLGGSKLTGTLPPCIHRGTFLAVLM